MEKFSHGEIMKDQIQKENELSKDRLEGQIQNWVNQREREKKKKTEEKLPQKPSPKEEKDQSSP